MIITSHYRDKSFQLTRESFVQALFHVGKYMYMHNICYYYNTNWKCFYLHLHFFFIAHQHTICLNEIVCRCKQNVCNQVFTNKNLAYIFYLMLKTLTFVYSMHIHIFKDLYSKKDMKLVFSPFISCGEILSYSR